MGGSKRTIPVRAIAAPPDRKGEPADAPAAPLPAAKQTYVGDDMLRAAAEVMLRLEGGVDEAHAQGVFNDADEAHRDGVLDSHALVGERPGIADIVIGHRGTHTDWQWVLDMYAMRFPPWFNADTQEEKYKAWKRGESTTPVPKPKEETIIERIGGMAPLGRVHLGFLVYWLAVHEQVRDAVAARLAAKDWLGKRPKILICGHSLGAGAAGASLLAQCRFFDEHFNADIYAVLFGAPRSGTLKYVEALEAQGNLVAVTRVVNNRDMVAHLPIDWNPLDNVGGDFTHVRTPWIKLVIATKAGANGKPAYVSSAESRWGTNRSWVGQLVAAFTYVMGAVFGKWSVGAAANDHNFVGLYYPATREFAQRGNSVQKL